MSAYSNGHGSQVLSLYSDSQPPSLPKTIQELEIFLSVARHLPGAVGEIEAFVVAARQVEAALQQERALSKRNKDELKELHSKYHQVLAERETHYQELQLRNKELESRNQELIIKTRELSTYKVREKGFREHMGALKHQISTLTDANRSMEADLESLREERKKAELALQVSKVENEAARNTSRKSQLDLEILKAKCEQLGGVQASEKNQGGLIESLRAQVFELKKELSRYQEAWRRVAAMDQKARTFLQSFKETGKRLEVANTELEQERRRRLMFEEQLDREKREKQVALTCLHKAEAKLNRVEHDLARSSQENEELKTSKTEVSKGSAFELKF